MESINSKSAYEWHLLAIRQKQHSNAQDEILGSLPNKKIKIADYLIRNVDQKTNMFKFSILNLANHFNCSKQTVRAGIHLLDDNPYLIITNHFIRYKNYRPIYSKDGDYND